MGDIENFLGCRRFPSASPFRSVSFLAASTLGLVTVVTSVYVTYRHWQSAPAYVAPSLIALIGLQLVYQWWRVLKYRARVRELHLNVQQESVSVSVKERSSIDTVVHFSARGMIDLLFFSNGMTLVALLVIERLLSQLDGLR